MTKNTITTVSQVRKYMNTFGSWINDDLMEQQEFLAKEMDIKGLRYHDHYYSFFHTVENRTEFINSMYNAKYYFMATTTELIKKVYEALNRLYIMDYNSKHYDELDEWLDKKANELCRIYDDMLHDFENPSDDVIDDIIQNMLDCEVFADYYIDEDTGDLYRHHEPIPAREELVEKGNRPIAYRDPLN